jgi:hypothetical protein
VRPHVSFDCGRTLSVDYNFDNQSAETPNVASAEKLVGVTSGDEFERFVRFA